MEQEQQKIYLVEHIDKGLFEWSMYEYQQMILFLKNQASLVFTNTKQFEWEEDPQNEDFKKFAIKLKEQESKNVQFIQNPLKELIIENTITLNNQLIKREEICLLDLRADKELSPEDRDTFKVFVFGGILGEDPPIDRTKILREQNFPVRRLGPVQLSTDTAVLMSKIIIENQIELDKIPYVESPEIIQDTTNGVEKSFSMENFRYVTEQFDIINNKMGTNSSKNIIMHNEIKNRLGFQDIEF